MCCWLKREDAVGRNSAGTYWVIKNPAGSGHCWMWGKYASLPGPYGSLRRMTPAGQAIEIVMVVEHNAFVRLYRDELEQEGISVIETDVQNVPRTTVCIFPDPRKDILSLDIQLPRLTPASVSFRNLIIY